MQNIHIANTSFGKMLLLNSDTNQGSYYLSNNKHFDQDQLDMLKSIVEKIENPVILDAGANLGWFSFEMYSANKNATVISVEPQEFIYYMLCGTIAINEFFNIKAINAALGKELSEIPVPVFDYSKTGNFGGVELRTYNNRQKEFIGQYPEKFNIVKLITIDSLKLKKLDVLKIDVEGMEFEVLEGALDTIARCKPIIFIEFLKLHIPTLVEFLHSIGYEIKETHSDNFLCYPM